jgi:transcription elongation factor Elf1
MIVKFQSDLQNTFQKKISNQSVPKRKSRKLSREVYTCPHCLDKADKISEDQHYVKVKCRSCEMIIELDKVDL